MTTLLAWVAFPLGMALLVTGVGMLAERLARVSLPSGLLAPVGASAAIVMTLPVYVLGVSAPLAGAILVAAAAAGAVLGRRRSWEPGWWAAPAAALAAYLLYLAPVILSGHWTWSGYNFVNDTSVNFVIVDHVVAHGDTPAAGGGSTTANIIAGTLGAGYPLGAHALIGTLVWLMPLPLEAVYQPFIAMLMALAAMALTELARRLSVPAVAAAAIALVGAGANLTYHYALHGAFKEIAIVTVLATAAAVARVALDERLRPGPVALVAVSLAAAVGLLSGAAVAYIALVAAVLLAAALGLDRTRAGAKPALFAAAVGAGVIVIAVSPFIREAVRFWLGASDTYSSAASLGGLNSTSVLGHLVRALPAYQGLGTWLRDDYRYPLEPDESVPLTTVALVVTGLLALGALVHELVRRRLGAWLVAVPAALVYAIGAPRLSPYAEAKLLMIASPFAVFAAALGAWWLIRRFPPAGVLAAGVLVAGVTVSDALAYHYVRLAPTDRMAALTDAAERAGGGMWLYNEWEEFAKYFGRDAQLSVASESFSPKPAHLREPAPIFARTIDLDEMTLPYVQSFAGAILRKGPSESRPPASFSPVYENEYYELWRRDPSLEVLDHIPLTLGEDRGGRPRCSEARDLAARVGPGERLMAAPATAPLPALDPTRGLSRPLGWDDGFVPEVVVPGRPGRARTTVDVEGGRYRVWLRATTGRPLWVEVDGRRIGEVQQVNTPGTSLLVATVELAPGRHRVTLGRDGGTLKPGDGFRGEIGRLVFEPAEPERVVTIPPERASRLCGREWDWIARVRVLRD